MWINKLEDGVVSKSLESAKLAEKDAKELDDFADTLRAYNWEVEACGRSGNLVMQQLQDKAPRVLKILANYLRP